jgi:hypothetical protein
MAVRAAQDAAGVDVVAFEIAVLSARGGTLAHVVAAEATVVFTHTAAAHQVVAVLVAVVTFAAEIALVAVAALAALAGVTVAARLALKSDRG